jgi:hypothetical protein
VPTWGGISGHVVILYLAAGERNLQNTNGFHDTEISLFPLLKKS